MISEREKKRNENQEPSCINHLCWDKANSPKYLSWKSYADHVRKIEAELDEK